MKTQAPYNRTMTFLFINKRRNSDLSVLLKPDVDRVYIGSRSASHFASHGRFSEAVDILLKAGASTYSKDDYGSTPRDYERFSEDYEVLY